MSSTRIGKPNYLVGRDITNCGTLNEVNSFVGIDIGKGRYLFPECYSIRNRNSSTHAMINWDF